jgi:DNA mismatch endonuclease, patch repair protein
MTPSSVGVSERMSRVRRRDTAPELELRSELHRRGLRYRVDRRPLKGIPSRADLVFGPAKVAVYVDGCFWHSCPEHGTMPRSNEAFWQEKLARNQERDATTNAALAEAGWTVVRIWEHEEIAEAADRVEAAVREGRGG